MDPDPDTGGPNRTDPTDPDSYPDPQHCPVQASLQVKSQQTGHKGITSYAAEDVGTMFATLGLKRRGDGRRLR
jgi:hypothetical protein